MAYTRSSRGDGKGPGGAGKPDGSECFQRLEERLVEQIAQQQAAAGANQTLSSVQTFRGSTAPPDRVASPAVAEVAVAIAAGAPPVVVVETNQTAATTGVAPSLTGPATSATEDDSLVAERARARANLVVMFRKFDPPTYDGEIPDPLLVVNWVDTMERLFNGLFIEEREKVPLAMHYLKGSADTWLTSLQRSHNTNNPFPSWSAFKEKFSEAFFPDSVKHQLEIDLYKLRQGSRTVWEYQQEFSRLVHCIPYVIRSDCHEAQMFLAGIRLDIYRVVLALKLQTYKEVVDRALHVEYGQAVVCAEREAMDKEKKKKRPYSRSGGGSSCSKKPSNHPQSYFGAESASIGSQQQRAQSCVICGGSHRVTSCPQGAGRCYRCGQSGHVRANCSERWNAA